jgi:hypothetical protein
MLVSNRSPTVIGWWWWNPRSRKSTRISPLVGGDWNLEHFICFHILGRIIPTDLTNIFQRGRYTTNQPSFLFGLWKIPAVCRVLYTIHLAWQGEKASKNTRPRTSMEIWCQWNWSSWEVYGIFLQFHWNCDKFATDQWNCQVDLFL